MIDLGNKWFGLIDHTDTPLHGEEHRYEVMLNEKKTAGGIHRTGCYFSNPVDALSYVWAYLKNNGFEDIAVDYDSFSVSMPDPSLSIDDINKCGYDFDYLMLPLSKERAMEIRDNADVTVYALYDDSTEAAIDDVRQFNEHKGLFGIELEDWKIARERLLAIDNSISR